MRARARVCACACLFVHANLRACECAIRGAASCIACRAGSTAHGNSTSASRISKYLMAPRRAPVLQHAVPRCNMLYCVATCCSASHWRAERRAVLERVSPLETVEHEVWFPQTVASFRAGRSAGHVSHGATRESIVRRVATYTNITARAVEAIDSRDRGLAPKGRRISSASGTTQRHAIPRWQA